jgi:hypothetical protein
MAEGGIHPVRLYDSDGDPLDDGSGRLNVNAVLSASDNIEIGNVDIKLNGTGVSAGSDPMDNGTIRVALATNDTQFGEIGDDPAVDGNIHEQLRYIGGAANSSASTLGTIDGDTSNMANHLNVIKLAVYTDNADWDGSSKHMLIGGVRNDTPNDITDGDTGPLAVSSAGAVHIHDGGNSITVDNAGTFAVQSAVTSIVPGTGATNLGKVEDTLHNSGDVGVMVLGVRKDNLGTLTSWDGDYNSLQLNDSGALWAALDTSTGNSKAFNVAGSTASDSQRGIVPLIKMNEVVAAPSGHADNDWTYFQTDLNGSLYTTHGTTGMAQGNTTVGTSAMQLDEGTDGYDVACKRVDLTSDSNNAGHIYVGSADTIAADGSVGGIRLNAGDFYSLDINNLTHIWVEASEAGQELNFIYYT